MVDKESSGRGERHETQVENQCFKNSADGWFLHLPDRYRPGKAAAFPVWEQSEGDNSGSRRQR